MLPRRNGPFAPPFSLRTLLFILVAACSAAACDKKADPPRAEAPAEEASVVASASASNDDATTAPDAPLANATDATPDASTDASQANAHDAAAPPSKAPTPGASDAKPLACGKKPLPDCPLQGWMKTNANPPMAAADTPALGEVFDAMVKFAPPGYSSWASISRDGAKAARLGKLDGAKAACRSCHEQYKAKYRLAFRDRKL